MNFKEWIEQHPEYGVKVIEHPTKKQIEEQKKLMYEFIDELKIMQRMNRTNQ